MRYLVPDDFGKLAMVLVVFNFLQIFRDWGFSQAIIQTSNFSIKKASTAFWVQVVTAALLAIILYNSNILFEWLYNQSNLILLIQWISIDFFIGAIGITPIAILKKELKFKQLFQVNFIALIISATISLYLAYSGFGILALIAKLILWTTINSIGSFIKTRNHFKLILSKYDFKELFNFGSSVSGNYLISYLLRNIDDFLIGKIIGSNALGLYNRAYALMLLPLGNVSNVLQTVFTSAWSQMKDSKDVVKQNYIKLNGLIATITFPSMVILSVLALPFIDTVFGEKWVAMSTTLSILALVGMIQSVGTMVGTIFLVFDKNKLLFHINIIGGALTIAVLIFATTYFKTIEATAFAYGLSSLILLCPQYYFTGKILNTNPFQLLKRTFTPFLLSILIGIISFCCYHFLPLNNSYFKLAVSILFPLSLYIAILYFAKTTAWHDLMSVINEYKKGSYV